MIDFILSLRKNNIFIWVENNKLKISCPSNQKNVDFEYIKREKEKIITFLRFNKIYSKKDFVNKTILKDNTITRYPLSFAQERLYFIEKFERGTTAYNTPLYFILNKDTNKEILKKSLNSVIERHEILRTIYVENESGEIYQEIYNGPSQIREIKLSDQELNNRLYSDAHSVFDLNSVPPIKIYFYITESSVSLLINIHHICFDFWSSDIFINDVCNFYKHYLNNCNIKLPVLDIQYKDFSYWQRKYLLGNKLEEELSYWEKEVNINVDNNFPYDKQRPAEITYKGENYLFEIEEDISEKLRKLAVKHDTTLFSILLTAFLILLYKHTNNSNIVIGTPTANRNHSQLGKIIGLFINSTVIAYKVDPEKKIKDIICEVAEKQLDLHDHQELPFEKLVDLLQIPRDLSKHPIFQIMFIVRSLDKTLTQTNLFEYIDISDIYKTSLFDFCLFIDDSNKKLKCNLNYSTSLFFRNTIKDISNHYNNILNQIIIDTDQCIYSINLFGAIEYKKLIYNRSNSKARFTNSLTIHQLFEAQVNRTPNNIAIIFENQKLTYRELNEKSNQLAHAIRKEYKQHWNQVINEDTLIGIYIERGLEMIIGLLGILKTGAAYIPFDCAEPEERLKFKINDSNCKLILTSSAKALDLVFLTKTDILPLAIDSYWEMVKQEPITNPTHINKPTDLAYVIYTSGSAGRPKGVCVPHSCVINVIDHFIKLLKTGSEKSFLGLTKIAFDISVLEIFVPLISGAKLFITSIESALNNSFLGEYITDNNIDIIQATPSQLQELVNYLSGNSSITILSGGEILSQKLATKVLEKTNKLWNLYGPTETTVWSTAKKITTSTNINIGSPIQNTTLYVLDDKLNLLPPGAPGELYIGGEGVSKGYLNRPHITTQNFIKNPFLTESDFNRKKNSILYKTGDIVRRLSNGELAYVGRKDNQVKIRGHRVELEEIANKLLQHSMINDCVITTRTEEQNKTIVAYYTISEDNVKDTSVQQDILNNWKDVWENVYDNVSNFEKTKYAGWVSSFTGRAIRKNEMTEWTSNTIDIIKELSPKIALEIGCGTGLILKPISKICQKYFAFDTSPKIIAKLKREARFHKLKNVVLAKAPAHEINHSPLVEREKLDTIILNSVIQYFPNIQYLENIIHNTIELIEEGQVFIGDIRDFRLINEFHNSVQIFKALKKEENISIQEILKRAKHNIENEKELLVSPEYFINLYKKTKEIVDVQILPKKGRSLNEMTCFRYDVIFKISKNARLSSTQQQAHNCKKYQFSETTKLLKTLEQQTLSSFIVTSFPNSKTYNKYKLQHFFNEKEYSGSIAKLSNYNVKNADYPSIEQLYKLARKNNYSLDILLSLKDKFAHDLIFYKGSAKPIDYYINCLSNKKTSESSNTPSTGYHEQKGKYRIAQELKQYLANKLPDYMVPTYFVYMQKFPLNVSGKVDVDLLPPPEKNLILHSSKSHPRNELERMIYDHWQKILGITGFGIKDDFFELGGHSLLAMRLSALISKELDAFVPIKDIFNYPSIIKLASQIKRKKKTIKYELAKFTITPNKDDLYKSFPLSKTQEVFLFGRYAVFELGGIATHAYFEHKFDKLDINRFEETINILLSRHPSLRTVFDQRAQRFLEQIPRFVLKLTDFTRLNQTKQKQKIEDVRERLSHQVFNPQQYPLFEISATKTNDGYIVHFSIDALLMDGMSAFNFFSELFSLYNNPKAILPELRISFRDYILELEKINNSNLYTRDKNYWLKKIVNFPVDFSLPFKKQPNEIANPKFKRISATIDKGTWAKFNIQAQQNHISPTCALLVIYGIVMCKWSSVDSFVLNLTLFNRLPLDEQIDNLIGDFTTLNAFIFNYKHKKTFKDLAKDFQAILLDDIDHRLFSGVDVLREVKRAGLASYDKVIAPIVFTSMLNLFSDHKKTLMFNKIFQELNYSISQTSQVWIDNKVYILNNKLVVEWDFVDQLFEQKTAKDMHDAYIFLVNHYANHKWGTDIPDILPLEDLELIQKVNNSDKTDILPKRDFISVFNDVTLQNCNKFAVISKTGNKTYEELFSTCCTINDTLKSNGIPHNSLIAIFAEKGWEEVSFSIGILMSSSAFLPLNPEWPIDKIHKILTQAKCRYVLCSQNKIANLQYFANSSNSSIDLIIVDFKAAGQIKKSPILSNTLDNPAYVIYTSGSTGEPKGVCISHRSFINTINDINSRFNISPEDKVFALSKLSFDLSIYDIFGILSAGGTVVIPTEEEYLQPQTWATYIIENDITIWNSVPALMRMFVEYIESLSQNMQQQLSKTLKLILLSGDWIPINLIEKLIFYFPNTKLISLGGATEGAIWSILYPITKLDKTWDSIPYGKPMFNQKMYVLNKQLKYCPLGVVGDLYIGGIGIAQGYWRNKQLTDKSFMTHPETMERLYKTGDIGRIMFDGNIEFLGRIDRQVKIGGHRIELGEIEKRISELKYVKECVVDAVNKANEKQLVAYIIPSEENNKKLHLRFQRLAIQKNELDKSETLNLSYRSLSKQEIRNYFARKSYRCFEKEFVKIEKITSCLKATFSENKIIPSDEIKDLRIFFSYSCHSLRPYIDEKFIFPKYLYPSAGGLYPVRIYIFIPDIKARKLKIKAGIYYYNPDLHQLIRTKKQLPKTHEFDNILYFFYGYLPAIQPEYGDSSRAFCFLETGYMLYLINSTLQQYGLCLLPNNQEKQLSLFNTTTYLQTGCFKISSISTATKTYLDHKVLPIYLIDKQNYSWKLYSWNNNNFDLVETWIPKSKTFNHEGANRAIIEEASYLLIMGNDNTDSTHILAGQITQAFIEKLLQQNIGSCLIGHLVFEDILKEKTGLQGIHTAVALGKVSKTTINSQSVILSSYAEKEKLKELESQIKERIKLHLPDYMIPKDYKLLDTFPLTANGKVDKVALSKLGLNKTYVAPSNHLEKNLCNIWQHVIGISEIGICDNFWKLGGHSILAMQLIAEISKKINLKVSIKEIFDNPTILSLSEKLTKQVISKESTLPVIIPDHINIAQPFPLTDIQQAYLLGRTDAFEIGNIANHGYAEIDIEKLDIERLEIAFNKILKRHAMLRAVICNYKEQKFLESVPKYKIRTQNLKLASTEKVDICLKKWRKEMSHQIFNPYKWPLFDIRCSILPNNKTRLHLSLDLLIFDAFSSRIFMDEWISLYNDPKLDLPELQLTFRDYMLAFCELKKTQTYKQDKQYWLTRIKKMLPGPDLPTSCQANSIKKPCFARCSIQINNNKWEAFKNKCKDSNATLTSALLTLFCVALSRWSTKQNFSINLTLFSRLLPHEQINNILGDFTSVEIFSYNNKDYNDNFSQQVWATQNSLIKDLEHQLFSGVEVQREMASSHDAINKSIVPVVFTSLFGLETITKNKRASKFKEHSKSIYSIGQTSQVWIDNRAYENEAGDFVAEWDYVEQLFDQKTITAMHKAYCYLIEHFSENDWDTSIPEILPTSNLQLIKDANNTYCKDVLPNCTLPEMFIKSALRYPKKTAIVSSCGNKTYEELLHISYQLAHFLRNLNLGKNELVAVYMGKAWQEIASCLGIIISGAAYLPLNCEWPFKRIEDILKQAGCKHLVTTSKNFAEIKANVKDAGTSIKLIVLDSEDISKTPATSLSITNTLDDTAYVIFTSGSSGTPKGVAVSHRGALNTINDINRRFNITEKDSVFALSRLSFDLSIYDIFGLLTVGGTVVLPSDSEYKSPDAWINYLLNNKITIWNSVPALMNMLIQYLIFSCCAARQHLKHLLRVVLLSGDWIPVSLPEQVKSFFTNCQVVSLGGATEGSIWSIIYSINKVDSSWKSIPYGKAMYNQKMYILNENLDFCPIGVTGEIFIGGAGVTLGYWNDQATTEQSFILHSRLNERLYKTGDLGCLLPDGNIEFQGRKDSQVKIGGHRVELGEIEKRISELDFVKECIIDTVTKANEKQIVAYIISEKENNKKLHLRFQKKGIQKDGLNQTEILNLQYGSLSKQEIKNYFARKSYRCFKNELIKIQEMIFCLKETFLDNEIIVSGATKNLKKILSLSCRSLRPYIDEKITFSKYFYPSAGGLYPVRVYVFIPDTKAKELNIKAGVYYYNPDLHQLIRTKKQQPKEHEVNDVLFYFCGYLPAIQSEYGDSSRAFCFLETGYMLYLMNSALEKHGLCLLPDKRGEQISLFNATYYLQTGCFRLSGFSPLSKAYLNYKALPIYLVDKQNHRWKLYSWVGNKFDLIEAWIPESKTFNYEGANGEIIREAAYLLVLGNNNTDSTHILAGQITQIFMEKLLRQTLGSCLIGDLKLEGVLKQKIGLSNVSTAVAIGRVSKTAISKHDVILSSYSEKEKFKKLELRIKEELKLYLPYYMVPKEYRILDSFPLTANDKVDRTALSKLGFNNTYVAPRNKVEKKLCSIWQNIFNIKQIGIEDDFFILGGNSIIAVQLIENIKKVFETNFKIHDIFKLRKISSWASINSFKLKKKKSGGERR